MNPKQNEKVLHTVRKRVLKNHFNVAGIDYAKWAQSFDERSPELLSADRPAFEAGVQELLKDLRTSHTGFFHERPSQLLPQHTINATLGEETHCNTPRWFFLDVFGGGPAEHTGVKRGDVLHAVNGAAYRPPAMPPFRTGASHVLQVSAPDGSEQREITIHVPEQKGNRNVPPILPPQSISRSIIGPGVGLLRITWFPGSMGLAFSKTLDRAVLDLKHDGCTRLIIDLRGNIGGGLGFARLASYLCPDRRPIGYSVTPRRQRLGFRVEDLQRVAYPDSALGLGKTLAQFALRDKSIWLLTQGVGPQPFHGRTAILVNEWTNSAAEMVAAFAAENELATIIGARTAGNVLGAVNLRVGGGYWLRLPVFGWFTGTGSCLEGTGVVPHISVAVRPEELHTKIDRQLLVANELLNADDVMADGRRGISSTA